MKRLTRQILTVVLILVLAGGAGAAVFWGLSTTQGTRWLLTKIPPLLGINLTAGVIEGTAGTHLLLKDVRLELAQQKLAFDRLELRWKALLLLTGTLAVKELSISGVRIQDNSPVDNKPPVLTWPQVSKTARLFHGTISQIQVTNLQYRRLQEQPLLVTSVSGAVVWQDSHLTINNLTLLSPSVQLVGTASLGFGQPSLTADLSLALVRPVADMNRFSVQVRPGSGRPQPFVGTVMLSGATDARKLLELSGDVGMTRNSFQLRRLRLIKPGQKGLITADGSLLFTGREAVLALELKATGLDLAPQLNVPTDIFGTLTFAGTLERYQGRLNFSNKAKGWQAATVSSDYHGTHEGLQLAPLSGTVLDGSLGGNVRIDWRKGFAMQGLINARNLNPARISPDWKGVAHINANVKLAWPENAPVNGTISGVLLESSLHGQALTGELLANLDDNRFVLNRLALQGKGFNLQASGELDRRLTVQAQISDLSRLVPGAEGTVQAGGWLRWRDAQLGGNLTGTANRLAYNGVRIASARLSAQAEQGTDNPMQIAVTLRDLAYGQYRFAAVTVAANGTVPHHTLNATLRASGSEAALKLTAGYRDGLWKGALHHLAGSDTVNGRWSLQAPMNFALSSRSCTLSPLILTAGAGERVEVTTADLVLQPLSGLVKAQWTGLNLSRANPWLSPDTRVKGRISGQTKASILPGQSFELDGDAVLSGGSVQQKSAEGELNLSFRSAKGNWHWRGETLEGSLVLAMAEQGQARATFTLPLPARFPVAVNPKGGLRVSLTGQLQEKGMLTALFPGLIQESYGKLDVDLKMDGTWETARSAGTLRLSSAGAYLPTAGIHLKEIQIAAQLEHNQIRITSYRADSGAGHIEGTALLTLAGWQIKSYQGTIVGTNFQTVHFPELQIVSSPGLRFEGTPQKLALRGELRLPELNIIGTQSPAVIPPSSDVIREGKVVAVAKPSALALDIQIKLLLGEKVFIKASGVDAQLGGAIDLSMSSLDRISSKGEIKVLKGRYRTYGVNLEIVRGRLYFAGGPVTSPSLDFLALRSIGDIRAGVTVTGTLKKPVTRLYSEPAMPDIDILAYIVLGHPLGNSTAQASLVAQAAGALLTSGQAAVLQEQLKNKLGLSTLEIQGGVGGTTGAMGYKPLQVTRPGAMPADPQPGITETVLTVGKYLTPQLYLSYGRSLFTGNSLFRLRYDMFKHWQIETQTGSDASGVDLYYKFEFR